MSARYVRHFTARVHQTYAVTVPDEMLADPTYFDEDGNPTADFDQWACDNGRLTDEETEALDDWDLSTELYEEQP